MEWNNIDLCGILLKIELQSENLPFILSCLLPIKNDFIHSVN
jgi:hypothetical protein